MGGRKSLKKSGHLFIGSFDRNPSEAGRNLLTLQLFTGVLGFNDFCHLKQRDTDLLTGFFSKRSTGFVGFSFEIRANQTGDHKTEKMIVEREKTADCEAICNFVRN